MKNNKFAENIEKDIKKAEKIAKEKPYAAATWPGDAPERFTSMHKAQLWVENKLQGGASCGWAGRLGLPPKDSKAAFHIEVSIFYTKETGWTKNVPAQLKK